MRSLAVLLVLGLLDLHIASCLKICAFNVQSFGESKANNKKVMGILLKVLWAHCVQQPPQKEEQLMLISFLTSPDPLAVRLVPHSGGARF